MKSLTILHIPVSDSSPSRVRVSYRQELTAQPQEREAEFRFSVSDEHRRLIQWYLEEFLSYPSGEFITRADRAEHLMSELGEELFNSVFADRETHALYAHVADDLPNSRIVIHAADPVGISIPWELMRDPAKQEYGDLARLAHAFVRSQPDLIFPTPTIQDLDTFNILMVISRPWGPDKDVPFQSVARRLLDLFREPQHKDRIRLEVLRPPTFEELNRKLAAKPNFYHVLHFDGHGSFPQGSAQGRFYGAPGEQGRLIFEGEDGSSREVTGEELGGLLAGRAVPIVLLNACQSGMTRPDSLYTSVGNQLLKAGTCGVVAMAYSVYVQTAVRFMARLYQGLVNGEELARAVTYAREELRVHPQRIGSIELKDWVVPVLFESTEVRVSKPGAGLRLDPSILADQPAKSGTEIGCPERPAYGFIGRDGVVLELERAFQTETTVLLRGMAGIGKTETAVGFARWLAETGGLDGPIFFFSFEHYRPLAHVCDGVGETFSEVVRSQVSQDWHLLGAEKRGEIVLSILKQVPCLMIWDNFEPVHGFPEGTESSWSAAEQNELRGFLRDIRGGKTKVLITSRREEKWLRSIIRPVELVGLKPAEAQELALHVLRRAGVNVEEMRSLPQFNELLSFLSGNPLAIQIILPELKRISPQTLLDRLRSGRGTFSEEDPKQGRDRSLTASLTYRFDSLDAVTRKRLAILALFQGFVDAYVLVAMGRIADSAPDLLQDLQREQWTLLLDSAAQAGLLRRVGHGLYTVHPALPWFFRDLLDEAFPDRKEWFERAFTAAYAAYGAYLQKRFECGPQHAMAALRAEENNLMHALRFARTGGRWDHVQGILCGLDRLFVLQARWMEWERIISGLERDVTGADGGPLRGREGLFIDLLGHRAQILQYKRDFEGARDLCLRLKDHFEGVSDDRNLAVCLHQLGMIAEDRGQYDEAEQSYCQSLAIKERIGDEHGQAMTLHQLGMIALKGGKYNEAESWCRQSLAIKERGGDDHGKAGTLHQLGVLAQKRGEYDEAERWYHESLTITERIGDDRGRASALHNLGMIAEERGSIPEATSMYEQSEAIFSSCDDPHGLNLVRGSLERVRTK